MSKIKALITSLILTTSTAALAAPTVSFSASAHMTYSTGPEIRDHRVSRLPVTAYHQSTTAQWRALSGSMFADGRSHVRLESPMAYSWLKLQATAGVSFIEEITLRFADGTRQVIEINRNLDTRLPIQFAIQNRALVSVSVEASSQRANASFQLLGYGTIEQPPVYQPPAPLPQPAIRAAFAEHLSFAGTDGRRFITVESQPYNVRTVRLAAVESNVFVKQLLVSYTDGSTQTFKGIDTRIRAGQSLDFKLDGGNKQIARFVVYTDADSSPGELSIFGL